MATGANYYASTDVGAPVINGVSGSFTNWLDTICVGSGTAYGSKPKAGWSKLFSGTSKGMYQLGGGTGQRLRVLHDGSQGAASSREAVVRMGEGATDVDTLTDPTPTVALLADAACVWRLSSDTTSTARAWEAIVSPLGMILAVQWGGTNSEDVYVFGDYDPDDVANIYNCVINTRGAANSGSAGLAQSYATPSLFGAMSTVMFAMRTPNGAVKSPRAAFLALSANGAKAGYNGSLEVGPNSDGDLIREPAAVVVNGQQSTAVLNVKVAGMLPNLWFPVHAGFSGLNNGDVVHDHNYDPAARFRMRILGANAAFYGNLMLETTDTWQRV